MSKIKLKIKHIVQEERTFVVDAIKNQNRFLYYDGDSKVIIIKGQNQIKITVIRGLYHHEMVLKKNGSFGILIDEGQKIKYNIILMNLKITDEKKKYSIK